MKKILLSAFFLSAIFCQSQKPVVNYIPVLPAGGKHTDVIVVNNYTNYFSQAYSLYPNIPKGILEAVAFTQTHFNHITHPRNEEQSCSGIPKTYGVMGLTLDGKNYFSNNLSYVAQLSGYSEKEIISSPEKNILAYAKVFNELFSKAKNLSLEKKTASALFFLSELPNETEMQKFALNTQLYGILSFMNNPEMQKLYNFPSHNLDLPNFFGEENFKVLSASSVLLSKEKISNSNGNNFKSGNGPAIFTTDYGPALSGFTSCNHGTGRSQPISAVTIHDVEGSYAGAISWFQNCNAQVSAHYVVRSSDGQITQVVSEANTAWHVGSENSYTVGIEHEGYASQTGWYTNAMYTNSAALVSDICVNSGYGIDPLRTAWWPWAPTTYYNVSSIPGSCAKVKGHQHYPNQTHTDPGPNWDWDYFFKLVNVTPATNYLSTATGNFYDSGGAAGNYSDDERTIWTINPSGATNVTLTFNNFDAENTWDYIYVYDGPDIWSPLIGYYTGTTNPGTLIANSGTMTIEFRSDCSTTGTGWNASWTSNATTIFPANLAITTASCPHDSVTLHWSNSGAGWYVDVSDDPTFTSYYNKAVPNLSSIGCPGGFANNINNTVYLAFAPNTTYYWRVWDGSTETYGNSFQTPSCNYQDTACSGTFDDTGGSGSPYTGNEDYVSIIQPNNASAVTMNFTSFDLETDFDSLWIYDGGSVNAPLIGIYTGTVSPGTVVAGSGIMTIRFKADPFVNHSGWTANWNCTPITTGIKNNSITNSLSVFPNPFDENIFVNYSLAENSPVKISLVDVTGREISVYNKSNQPAGNYQFQITSKEINLSSGIYFLRLEAEGKIANKKIVRR